MNFPYSRERLNDLHSEHSLYEETQYIKDIADIISQQIISKAIATSKKQVGVVYSCPLDAKQVVLYFKHILKQSNRFLSQPRENYIPYILETIRLRFPDSNIQIDPLKTYISINWS
jgi:hypothetical protein